MLTATYTLVALSVEQASIRVSVQSFQQYVRANFHYHALIRPGQFDYACDALRRLYRACQWRKVELYLIPALRKAGQQADALLQALAALDARAAAVLAAVEQRSASAAIDSEARVAQFCATIDSFCNALLERIELEEKQLFPLARTLISGEAWFSIANELLIHDARQQEMRREQLAAPARARAIAPAAGPATLVPGLPIA